MFAGHFGLAAAVKAKTPKVPLWALMLSTQLLDVVFVPFLLTGKESIEPVEGAGKYGGSIIHADYSHSLALSLLIALAAGLLAWRFWGRQGGLVIGSVVMSHWVLDLFVHRADLPLLPGNAGNLPLLGFGLWQLPWLSAAAELMLVAVGAILYVRSLSRKRTHGANSGRMPAFLAGILMTVLLVLALLIDMLGI